MKLLSRHNVSIRMNNFVNCRENLTIVQLPFGGQF